ncbi:MAG: hypothetical protein R2725_03310 [Solirubrobacterales bacterium]
MRNITALGLALVAALAFGAVLASAASANEFTAEAESVEVTADQTEEGQHVFSVEGSEVKCNTAHFATEGEVAAPAESLEVHPEYGGCTAFGFVGSTIDTEGCNYVLNAGSTKTSGDTYDGNIDLICSESAVIKVTAGTCEAQIGSQEGLTEIMYTNLTGSGEVEVEANVTGIAVNKTKDGFLCPLSGTGEATGTYTGDTVASGVGGVGIAVE